MTRKVKRTVRIGNITIGGNNPIAVQTMLNIPVEDIAGILKIGMTQAYKPPQAARSCG